MDSNQLEKYRHDLAFLRKMADQTIKDFDRFSYSLSFRDSGQAGFGSYQLQLATQLEDFCKNDPSRLRPLFYVIDVPEHLMPPGSGCKNVSKMAELILQRELIKVVIKEHYR